MNQLLITLKDTHHADLLQNFLKTLAYVETVEWLPLETPADAEERAKEAHEEKQPVDYTVQAIEAIAQQFPEDHCWTYQDLQQHFPEALKIRVEILNQQIQIMPSPQELHQEIVAELFIAMRAHAKKYGLGKVIISPFDVVLDEHNVVVPDVVFISIERLSILDGKRANGSPDLLVEVWSPGNSKAEREKKRAIYEQKAVKEFWSIFPEERRVDVARLVNGRYQTFSEGAGQGCIRSSVLQHFEIQIEDFMPDIFFKP